MLMLYSAHVSKDLRKKWEEDNVALMEHVAVCGDGHPTPAYESFSSLHAKKYTRESCELLWTTLTVFINFRCSLPADTYKSMVWSGIGMHEVVFVFLSLFGLSTLGRASFLLSCTPVAAEC
jgi:hypothetical protein